MTGPATLWGGSTHPSCILESFSQTALRQPEAVAIVDEANEFTYAELLRWIGGIADVLIEYGVGVGDRVAVVGARSAAVVAAVWATVGLGGTYVPLDITYPPKRLAHMLTDSGAKVLLHTGAIPDFGTDVSAVQLPAPDADRSTCFWPRVNCDPDTPVYVIYTSGSTGLPKGVALPHRSIDNMVQWQQDHSVRADLCTAQFAPLNFDVWFQEVLGTLCGGGTLVVVPEELRRDPIALLDWLAEHSVQRLFLPCIALHMVTVTAAEEDSLDHLSLVEVNTSGEQLVCTPAIRDFFRRLPDCRLNNHYGQSESAMVTAHTLAGPSESWPDLPPIGAPLPGCEVLIDPVDPGRVELGELLVAGVPLAVGYLNQPALNLLCYPTVPTTTCGHTRVFRTGDLVRIEDGIVWFLGRIDHEVKIRGFRVNPLEVDACLMAQPAIVAAVTVAIHGVEGSRQLHAAVTTADDRNIDVATLLQALRELLPAHSVPLSITVLRALPHTPSGKIDREAVSRQVTEKYR